MNLRPVVAVGVIVLLVIAAMMFDSRKRTVTELTEIFQLQTQKQMLCATMCSQECLVGFLTEGGVIDFKEKEDGCLEDCTERLCPTTE